MPKKISRRNFFNKSFGLGAGMLVFKDINIISRGLKKAKLPLIITDHINKAGEDGVTAGWKILSNGGSALDAVEKSTNIVEVDPTDSSVGYGGLPNEDGVVQLDASIMDGKTYNAGSVAWISAILCP